MKINLKNLLIIILIVLSFIIVLFLIVKPCPLYTPPNLPLPPLKIDGVINEYKPNFIDKIYDLFFWYNRKFCPHVPPVSSIAFAATKSADLANLKSISSTLTRAYDKINIFDAWDFINSRPIPLFSTTTIGIIDTGVDFKHPEFENVKLGISGPPVFQALQDNAVEFRADLTAGHGTQIAGIIGANNLKIISSTSSQMNGIVSGVTDKYFLEPRTQKLMTVMSFGAIIDTLKPESLVNISFAGRLCPKILFIEIPNRFCIKEVDFSSSTVYFKEGIISHSSSTFIIAAGNGGINVQDSIPSNINASNTIIVAATELNDNRADFPVGSSNFGSGVNISAPGKEVYASAIRGKGNFPVSDPNNIEFRNYVTDFGGTSAAAPLVTGVAAILKSLEPAYQKFTPGLVMSPEKIKEILVKSADPINTGEPTKFIGSGCFNEKPTDTGCRLNAHRAVAWQFPPSPVENATTSNTTVNSISISWQRPDDFAFTTPDFDSYRIFRSTSSMVTLSSTLIAIITNSSTPSFTDSNLPSNTAFFYRVFVFDKVGLSSPSNQVSARTLLSAIPKPPKPYTLNPHTLFYTPLDNFYNFSGGTFIPELADNSSIPDPNHDCLIFTGSVYSIIPGQFNNALRSIGRGRGDIRENVNLICNNRPIRLIGTSSSINHTLGFWLKSNTPPETAGYIFFMFNFVGPEREGRPIWILLGADRSFNVITHPIIRPPINTLKSFNPRIFDGQFHHYLVVFNYTQKRIQLFIDGLLDQEISVITDIPVGENNTEVMMGQSGFWLPNAVLDDFFVENRAWIQEDLTRFLTTGNPPPTYTNPADYVPNPNTLPEMKPPAFGSSTILETSTILR